MELMEEPLKTWGQPFSWVGQVGFHFVRIEQVFCCRFYVFEGFFNRGGLNGLIFVLEKFWNIIFNLFVVLVWSFQFICISLEKSFCSWQVADLNRAALRKWDLRATSHHWKPLVFWDLELGSMYIIYQEGGPLKASASIFKVMPWASQMQLG